jgi:GNAT superfamily N-acetyltransferase
MKSVLWHSPLIGVYFGSRAVELAGIIVHPDHQKQHVGRDLVRDFVVTEQPSHLVAYTRNPALLRAVGHATRSADILTPSGLVIPHATLEDDGHSYHIGRYAPHGLYGSFDPAERDYQGVPLVEQCVYLNDSTNALAVSAEVRS